MSDFDIFMLGLMIGGLIIITLFFIASFFDQPIKLNQVTGDDICFKLINETSKAESDADGKLICVIPSYDSTQNIIIKQNDEVDE